MQEQADRPPRRVLPGGLTLSAFVVAEVVCTGTLVAAVLVAAL